MGLSSVASITISANSRGVTPKGFGTPLVVGKHTKFPGLIKEYSGATALDELVADGFSTQDPVYRNVASIVAPTARVKSVKVGRLLSDFSHIAILSVIASVPVEDTVYAFTLRNPAGVATDISYTVTTGQTQAQVATAIAALIDAVTDMGAAAVTGDITCTAANANEMWAFEGLDVELFDYKDTTAGESTLVAETTAIRNLDADWYGLVLADCPSKARLLALAAYAETLDILFGATTFDTETNDVAVTDDFITTAAAADYFRTVIQFSTDQNRFAAARWFGGMLTTTPGSATWAYKSLSGTAVSDIKEGRQNVIEAKGGNFYVNFKGLPVTFPGKVASGEWIDTVRFRDWVKYRMEESVVTLLANTPKVPYTNPGADMVGKEIEAVLVQGAANGGIDDEEPIVVTLPDVREVLKASRLARLLPDINAEATLAGAIHLTTITVTLKV